MKKPTNKVLVRNLLMIVLGSAIFALGFDLFLEPSGINCGGVSGIAMLIVYATDSKFLTVGILSAAINIPLFFFGYRQIGKYFFFGSMLGMAISSVCFDLFAAILPIPQVEPLVAPGGTLVYSTCSNEPEENLEQVNAFLVRHPDFKLDVTRESVPFESGHDGAFAARFVRR